MNTRSHPRVTTLVAAVGALMAGAVLAQAPAPRSSTNAAQDIRDIRGPKPVASGWWVPVLLGGCLAGAGAGYAAWAWFRRRSRRGKSPQELALARLEAARSLIQEGNSREYSIELSATVRQYIEDAFHIVATHLTTDEFLRHFAQTPDSILVGSQDLLGDFLQSCDLAKFGGWNLTASGMSSMLDAARRFVVESSRPRDQTSRGEALATDDSRETYDSLPST